jgi:tetratricopeptide (TPR) repeat protein
MLILYDFTFGKWRKNYKLWFAFFVLLLLKLLPMIVSIKQRVNQVSFDIGQHSMSNPVFNMAYSFFSHLSLLIWPLKLTLYHEPNIISPLALGTEIFLLVLLILFLPLIFKRTKIIFFAICLFILFLLPTYSPVNISWLVAERYLYFPSLTLSMLVAFWIDRYTKKGMPKKWFSLLLIFLITLYSLRTIVRNFDWKTHTSIWKATVEVSPKSPKAHNNMGDVYSLEGNLEKAASEFIRAIELRPNYADAYHNLANTYEKMGKTDEAIINYKQAVSINPLLYQSYLNLGIIYLNKKQDNLAKDYFRRVLEIKPDNISVRQILKELENVEWQ